MSKKVSVAVIGCGKMGKTIIDGLLDAPELGRLVGYDILPEAVDKLCAEVDILEPCYDFDKLLADKDIELIYIASSNNTHVDLAVRAMRAGKSVMTEKPSGVNYEEIEELIRVQKETGAFLQVGLELRYSKAYVEIKNIIKSGEIGELKNVHFTYSQPPFAETLVNDAGEKVTNWRVKKDTSGDMFLEKLCHYIDIVRWWNEGARIDTYVATNAENVIPYFEIEDNVHISYRFDNGCVSQLFFIMTAAPGHNSDLMSDDDLFAQDKQGHKLNYIVTGTEGAVELDVFQRQIRVYHHPGKKGQIGESIVRTISWERDDPHSDCFGEKEYFHNTYDQNLDIIRRVANGEPPAISIEDAQESMRLCLEFSAASKENKWKIIKR